MKSGVVILMGFLERLAHFEEDARPTMSQRREEPRPRWLQQSQSQPHDDGDMEKEVGLLVSRAWKERENQNLQEQY